MFNNKVRHLLDGDKENRMSSIILRKKKKNRTTTFINFKQK